MSHVRTQIREAAASALSALGAVSVSRAFSFSDSEVPVYLVSTDAEDIEGGTHGAYRRTLTVIVECVAKGATVDTELDAMVSSVEQTLNRSTLGGLCKPMLLTSLRVQIEPGAVPIGRLRMEYAVLYFTEYTSPEAAI